MRKQISVGALVFVAAVAGAATARAAPTASQRNQDVMDRLKPTCIACHADGTNIPLFASLTAFESLLVYNRYYVIPGKPDDSELVRLLAGSGTRTYRQMPVNGVAFAALDQAGQTKITMTEIRQWVTQLVPRPEAPAVSAADAPSVRRLTAEQIVQSLLDQLGLTPLDLAPASGGEAPYAVRSPDALGTAGSPQALQLFDMLGGPDWLNSKRRSTVASPVFLQALIPVSQAWCRMAVKKPGNTALFKEARSTDRSASAADAIRKNIAYLHLRMLGEPATGDAVDDLFTHVFVIFEPKSAETAWTAVCAALVRHPLWLSY